MSELDINKINNDLKFHKEYVMFKLKQLEDELSFLNNYKITDDNKELIFDMIKNVNFDIDRYKILKQMTFVFK